MPRRARKLCCTRSMSRMGYAWKPLHTDETWQRGWNEAQKKLRPVEDHMKGVKDLSLPMSSYNSIINHGKSSPCRKVLVFRSFGLRLIGNFGFAGMISLSNFLVAIDHCDNWPSGLVRSFPLTWVKLMTLGWTLPLAGSAMSSDATRKKSAVTKHYGEELSLIFIFTLSLLRACALLINISPVQVD